MRRIIASFLLALALLAGPVAAQQHGWGFNTGADSSYVLPQTNALVSQFATPPTAARKALINTYINRMVVCGAWDRDDFRYVLAAADSQAALINWKNPGVFTAQVVGAPTFVADRGFTGGSTSNYIDTTFVPSNGNSAGSNLSIASYALTNVNAGGQFDIGTNRTKINSSQGGAIVGNILSTTTVGAGSVASSIGLSVLNQFNSTTSMDGYKNGVNVGSGAVTNTAFQGFKYFILAISDASGNPASPSTRQIAMARLSRSYSAPQILCEYNATLAYLQGVGAQ